MGWEWESEQFDTRHCAFCCLWAFPYLDVIHNKAVLNVITFLKRTHQTAIYSGNLGVKEA